MITDSTALVTGANRGIGLEFCRQLLSAGNLVIATCRHPDQADALQKLQQQYQQRLRLLALDVNNASQRHALADSLRGQPIDLLLSNAGVYGPKRYPLGDLPEQTWLEVLQTNVIAPIKLVEALLENLAASRGSKIAMLSSKMGSMGDNGSGGSYIYRSSKAALNAAVKSLSIDLATHRIAVLALHPGWVQTDMGGPNALITAQESVNGMLDVISGLNLGTSGQFISYDGKLIPW